MKVISYDAEEIYDERRFSDPYGLLVVAHGKKKTIYKDFNSMIDFIVQTELYEQFKRFPPMSSMLIRKVSLDEVRLEIEELLRNLENVGEKLQPINGEVVVYGMDWNDQEIVWETNDSYHRASWFTTA